MLRGAGSPSCRRNPVRCAGAAGAFHVRRMFQLPARRPSAGNSRRKATCAGSASGCPRRTRWLLEPPRLEGPVSSPQSSERQPEYTNRYPLDGVHTPQVVVDRRYGLVGSDGPQVSSPPFHVAVIGFDFGYCHSAAFAGGSASRPVLRLATPARGRVTTQAIPGEYMWRPVVRIARAFFSNSLADSRSESRQVEVHGLALTIEASLIGSNCDLKKRFTVVTDVECSEVPVTPHNIRRTDK